MTLTEAKSILDKHIQFFGKGFHPDTPFEDYITDKALPCYTPEESQKLDAELGEVFDAFDVADEDIYEYCMESPVFKMKLAEEN